MKVLLMSILAVLIWPVFPGVEPYNPRIHYPQQSQGQVNFTTQFPAQNQFFIDDFNRIQRDGGIMYFPPGVYSYGNPGPDHRIRY